MCTLSPVQCICPIRNGCITCFGRLCIDLFHRESLLPVCFCYLQGRYPLRQWIVQAANITSEVRLCGKQHLDCANTSLYVVTFCYLWSLLPNETDGRRLLLSTKLPRCTSVVKWSTAKASPTSRFISHSSIRSPPSHPTSLLAKATFACTSRIAISQCYVQRDEWASPSLPSPQECICPSDNVWR